MTSDHATGQYLGLGYVQAAVVVSYVHFISSSVLDISSYASNNGMHIKRDNVRIKRIVLDLRDAVVDKTHPE